MTDRKRRLGDAGSGAIDKAARLQAPGAGAGGALADAAPRANTKRKASGTHAPHPSEKVLAATEVDLAKKMRVEVGGSGCGDVAAAAAAGAAATCAAPPPAAADSTGAGGSGVTPGHADDVGGDDFVSKLAEQLQKIALYGNVFFTELAFGGHVAAATATAAGGGGGGGSKPQQRQSSGSGTGDGTVASNPPTTGGGGGRHGGGDGGGAAPASAPLRSDAEYFDTLQASRGQLFALVEEMLLRAHEIDDVSPPVAKPLAAGAATPAGAAAPAATAAVAAKGLAPAPAPGPALQAARRAAALSESNGELSRRGKEVSDAGNLLDSVLRHLYNHP